MWRPERWRGEQPQSHVSTDYLKHQDIRSLISFLCQFKPWWEKTKQARGRLHKCITSFLFDATTSDRAVGILTNADERLKLAGTAHNKPMEDSPKALLFITFDLLVVQTALLCSTCFQDIFHRPRTLTLRLRSMRPLLRMDTAQVRGGGQQCDGTRTRASNNLRTHTKHLSSIFTTLKSNCTRVH